jgi:glycosyltransferase involved in cell wall biosynthesis
MAQSSHNTVLFLSKGERSASTRYRALNYFDRLTQAGWNPYHLTLASGSSMLERWRILRQVSQADVVVLIRRTVSGPFFWLLRLLAKRLVFDFDDAIFCRSDGDTSTVRQFRFNKIISKCDAVWAGNDYLAENARSCNQNISMIPTAVDLAHFQPCLKKNEQYVDCVWIGSSSTRRYLDNIIPLLDELAAELSQLRLKVIADFAPDTGTIPVVAVPWTESGEAEALASAHIGIAPMIENNWTSGKCGLKVIQYMAAGLPVITDNAGVNKIMVDHQATGFIARSNEQWQAAIISLANDPNLARQMGARGRNKVDQHYSLQSSFEKMLASLSGLKH